MQIDAPLFATVGFRRFPVMNWEQVSTAYRNLLDELGLGASQAPRCIVQSPDGKTLAHVSYNGKVWPGEHWRDGEPPLYVPSY